MRWTENDLYRFFGLLLGASVPLLIWQVVPGNQQAIPHAAFLALHSLMEIFASWPRR